jgi:hypothetical protein
MTGLLTDSDSESVREIAAEAAAIAVAYYTDLRQPSFILKPDLSIDGNQWCALFGDNLQDGVSGFGDSPELAYLDFDRSWTEKLSKVKHG